MSVCEEERERENTQYVCLCLCVFCAYCSKIIIQYYTCWQPQMLTKFHWFFSMFLVSHINLHSSSVLPSLTDLWAYCCPQFRKWPTHASIIRNIIAIGVSIVPCNAYQRWVTVPICVNHHPQLTIPLLLLRTSSCCLPNPIAVWQPCIHVRRTWTWKVFSYFTYTQQSKVCPCVCVHSI